MRALRDGRRADRRGARAGARGRRLHHLHLLLDGALLPRVGARPGRRTRIVSIGPVTSATLRERGLEPHVEAARHDIDGVVEAIVADRAGAMSARASR